MSGAELRKKFLDFFQSKGHTIVPSSSLMSDDPSVLLTTAGMQQFKPYYTGAADPMKDFGSKNTASVQKSFRTSDIDEVGDKSHLTFFEMLGNFSFGGPAMSGVEGYFKKDAIQYAKEFLESIGLTIGYVTVFEGDEKTQFDEESYKIWQSLGIKDIRKAGREDNFWGPTGTEGPCGPTTEIYINGVEIWNIVFNEYYEKPDGAFEKLKTPGVDTGMGLERLTMVVQGKKNIFETDLFEPIFEKITLQIPGRNDERARRVIADHVRGITFLLADGVRPSNKGAGYVLRRLMRRVIIHGVEDTVLYDTVIQYYGDFYKELVLNREEILTVATNEYEKFIDALRKGLSELKKMNKVDAQQAFKLYESFGLPYEVIKDFNGGRKAKNLTREGFEEEFKKHQKISRAGAEKKFGGHGILLDTGELKAADEKELQTVTRLHTATHLLQAALRKVLGEDVHQMGSDITAERTRFDFNFDRKLTPDELHRVEELVNFAIKQGYSVEMREMPMEEAAKSGALHFFSAKGGKKYPDTVHVYSVGNFKADPPEVFSRELCGGPHVKNTSEIGHFKVLKEEAVAAGIRRIRARAE